jgi:hypothetical protein
MAYTNNDDKGVAKTQTEILRVLASIRQLPDPVLWRFLRTLAYAASQHHDMGEVPFDLATHFVIKHHDNSHPDANLNK